MEKTIKRVVSDFTKIPIEQINEGTEIGRSVLVNSILVHRMFAAIAKEGVPIDNYQEIKTYGDLLSRIPGNISGGNLFPVIQLNNPVTTFNETGKIGIDMEEISNLPRTSDFWEEEFYKLNFTSREIAYCVLQPDPYASFAGLFAAKEAIVKADGLYRNIPFNKIDIDHLPDGQPVFNGFKISIAHTNDLATAVAFKEPASSFLSNPQSSANKYSTPGKQPFPFLSLLAFILAVVALLLTLFS